MSGSQEIQDMLPEVVLERLGEFSSLMESFRLSNVELTNVLKDFLNSNAARTNGRTSEHTQQNIIEISDSEATESQSESDQEEVKHTPAMNTAMFLMGTTPGPKNKPPGPTRSTAENRRNRNGSQNNFK